LTTGSPVLQSVEDGVRSNDGQDCAVLGEVHRVY